MSGVKEEALMLIGRLPEDRTKALGIATSGRVILSEAKDLLLSLKETQQIFRFTALRSE